MDSHNSSLWAYLNTNDKYSRNFTQPQTYLKMIVGIGIDIVLIRTIESEIFNQDPLNYLSEFCTSREIEYCLEGANTAQRAAARFAAKEAAMKALSTGWAKDVEPLDFEIINEQSGAPKMLASGQSAKLLKELGVSKIWVSLSHCADYAIAQVILES